MAANVKIVKLLTGEDLLTEVLPSSDQVVIMKNPVRILVLPNKIDPKTPQIGLAPWAEFAEEKTFTVDKSHVVAIMTPIKDFVNQYNGMFGGIYTASGPGLILPGA